MRFDPHVHTSLSSCSNLDPSMIVSYAKKAGLSGVAITDHNSVKAAGEIPEEDGFMAIPGIEVSTKDGDLIGLFVSEPVHPGLGSHETADKIRDLGGLVIAPHPFDRFRKCVGDSLDEIGPDFIESFNSRVVFHRYNRMAEAAAENLDIKKIAGSDAHFREELGLAGIAVDAGSPEELRKAMLKGRYELFGRYSSPFVHVKSAVNRIVRRM